MCGHRNLLCSPAALNNGWLMHSSSEVPLLVLFSLPREKNSFAPLYLSRPFSALLTEPYLLVVNKYPLIEVHSFRRAELFSEALLRFSLSCQCSYIWYGLPSFQPRVQDPKLKCVRSSRVFVQKYCKWLWSAFYPVFFRMCGPLTVIIMHCSLSWLTQRLWFAESTGCCFQLCECVGYVARGVCEMCVIMSRKSLKPPDS